MPRRSAMVCVVIALVLIIIAGFISVYMALSFTRPVEEVNNAVGELADGKFSEITKFTNRSDEFGAMVNHVNYVIVNPVHDLRMYYFLKLFLTNIKIFCFMF